MLMLKILSLTCQLVLVAQTIQQLRLPYQFGRWRIAWGWMLVAMVCTVARRLYDLWTDPLLGDVVFGLGVTIALMLSLQMFSQIFHVRLGPPRVEPVARLVIDQYSQILSWDATATRLFGWTTAEAMGQTLMQTIIPPRDWEAHRAGLARYLTQGDEGRVLRRTFAVNGRCKDGREIPVELLIEVLPADETGIRFTGQIRALVHL